jgi:hypothetical protein
MQIGEFSEHVWMVMENVIHKRIMNLSISGFI